MFPDLRPAVHKNMFVRGLRLGWSLEPNSRRRDLCADNCAGGLAVQSYHEGVAISVPTATLVVDDVCKHLLFWARFFARKW